MTDPTTQDLRSTTERELIQRLADALAEWRLGGGPPEDTADADLIVEARAYLAQPEPEAPTDEDLEDLADVMNVPGDSVPAMRRALQLWGHQPPAPVSLSERQPTREASELDAQGTCWNYHPTNLHYCLCLPDSSVHTHWLPHWALPVPNHLESPDSSTPHS